MTQLKNAKSMNVHRIEIAIVSLDMIGIKAYCKFKYGRTFLCLIIMLFI